MSPARPEGRGLVLRAAACAVAALLLFAGSPGRAQEEHTHTHEGGGSVEADNDPRVIAIASQLTCYCGCNTQSVADCTCGVAQSERRNILANLDEGKSGDQIIAAWVEKHGPRILIAPPAQGFNLLGWLLPSVTLVAAALFLVWRMRRWTDVPAATTAAGGPLASPDSTYAQKLREELERRRS